MRRPQGGRRAALRIEVVVGSPQWRRKPKAAAIVRKALRTAARDANKSGSTRHAELAILLTDDSAICALNHDWRKRNVPTNVLSFPAKPARAPRGQPRHLGDIVIAYQTLAREAAAEAKPFEHHLAHLAVHGYLHLLGYDHANDRDASKMVRLDAAILARLGVPDPYIARNPAA